MPLYDFRCQVCNAITDHHVPIAQRLESQDCPECGAEKAAKLTMQTAPRITQERIVGGKRLIWDERQVTSEHGPRWRDKDTTGKEGGAGKRMYFH